jgi:hypothetical protein
LGLLGTLREFPLAEGALMRRFLLYGVLAAGAISMAGCHGGSSSAIPTTPEDSTASQLVAAPGLTGSVDFTVTVPATASGSAIPKSMVVTLTQGAGPSVKMAPLTMNLSASTYGCQALSTGGLKCVAAVTAPSGNDTFSIATYAGQNGSGTRLSTAQSLSNVVASSLNKTACTPKSSDLAVLQSSR